MTHWVTWWAWARTRNHKISGRGCKKRPTNCKASGTGCVTNETFIAGQKGAVEMFPAVQLYRCLQNRLSAIGMGKIDDMPDLQKERWFLDMLKLHISVVTNPRGQNLLIYTWKKIERDSRGSAGTASTWYQKWKRNRRHNMCAPVADREALRI